MNGCLVVTDLREALLALARGAWFAPDEPSPSPAGDTGSEPPEGAARDGEDTTDDDELDNDDAATDDAKVSRVKELSDEAAKWRRKFREANDRIDTLEKGNADEALKVENQDLRLRMAFNDECHAHDVSDRDAIWKLAGDDITVAVNDDGTVDMTRLRTVVGSLTERYPHFVKDDAPAWVAPDGPATGKRSDGKMRRNDAAASTVLVQKFPALRGR